MSGLPRYLEGARYWLQWAGMPEYIYSPYHGEDDYKDDYTSRGNWVNYLAGGSRVTSRTGLNILLMWQWLFIQMQVNERMILLSELLGIFILMEATVTLTGHPGQIPGH